MPRPISFEEYIEVTAPRVVTFTEGEVEPIVADQPPAQEIIFSEAEGETSMAPAPPPSMVPVPDVLASPRGGLPGSTPSAPYAGVLDPPGAPNWLFSRPPSRRARRRVQPSVPPSGPPVPPVPVLAPEAPASPYHDVLRPPRGYEGVVAQANWPLLVRAPLRRGYISFELADAWKLPRPTGTFGGMSEG
jgi:hypothetical protein